MSASTSPGDRRTHWNGRYRTIGATNVSWYEPEPLRSLELLDRLGVGPDRSVIDVGGGASGLAGALVARGVGDMTVLDVSGEALAVARAAMVDPDAVTWVEADLLSWAPPRRWDVWHDRAVFHFLTEDDQRGTYRRLLRDALEPGGLVLVMTFAPDGPEQCSELPVRRYGPDDLLAELDAGLEAIDHGHFIHMTPGGGPQPFTWVAARRPSLTSVGAGC